MEKKLIPIGVCTILSEEAYIEEWANMLNYFCEKVVALVDPTTNDNTVRILREKCPFVKIQYQDRSLGDSDNNNMGNTRTLIMHVNKSKWIQENVQLGEWFIEMAADERFDKRDYAQLEQEIRFAQEHGLNGIVHQQLYEPINCYDSQLIFKNGWFVDVSRKPKGKLCTGFVINWNISFHLAHVRFQKKIGDWIQNNNPHSGFANKCKNTLMSTVPIWHYHRLKSGLGASCWRDGQGSISEIMRRYNGLIPVIPAISMREETDDMIYNIEDFEAEDYFFTIRNKDWEKYKSQLQRIDDDL